MENNKKLPFLDVEVHRSESSLGTSVYRKPTNTGRYLNFHSHHPDYIKKGIVSCLQHRARTICADPKIQREELEDITTTFERNDYPRSFVNKRKRNTATDGEEQEPITTASLPYCRGVSEKLRRICAKYNIRTVFNSETTLRRSLTRVKPPVPKDKTKNCIYNIPCSCGRSYTGETGRPISVRLQEHRRATEKGETNKSGVAEHVWANGNHCPEWDRTTIVHIEPHWKKRKIKEAAFMALADVKPLSQPSLDISPIWLPLLRTTCVSRDRSTSGLNRTSNTEISGSATIAQLDNRCTHGEPTGPEFESRHIQTFISEIPTGQQSHGSSNGSSLT